MQAISLLSVQNEAILLNRQTNNNGEGFSLVFKEKVENVNANNSQETNVSKQPENNPVVPKENANNKSSENTNSVNEVPAKEAQKQVQPNNKLKDAPTQKDLSVDNTSTAESNTVKVNSNILLEMLTNRLAVHKDNHLPLKKAEGKASAKVEADKKVSTSDVVALQNILAQLQEIRNDIKVIDTKAQPISISSVDKLISKVDKLTAFLKENSINLSKSDLQDFNNIIGKIKDDLLAAKLTLAKNENITDKLSASKVDTLAAPKETTLAGKTDEPQKEKVATGKEIASSQQPTQKDLLQDNTANLQNIGNVESGSEKENTSKAADLINKTMEKVSQLMESMDAKIVEVKQTIAPQVGVAGAVKPNFEVKIENALAKVDSPKNTSEGEVVALSVDSTQGQTDKVVNLKEIQKDLKELASQTKENKSASIDGGAKDDSFVNLLNNSDANGKDITVVGKEVVTSQERINFIEKQTQVMNQFTNFLALNKLKGETEVTLKLYPKELGEIKINLTREQNSTTSETSIIAAKFHVTSETVKSILESNFNLLKDSLSQNGNLQLGALSVEVNTGGGSGKSFSELYEQLTPVNKGGFSLGASEDVTKALPVYTDNYAGSLNSFA